MKNILFKFYLKNKIFISLYLIITLIIGGTILFGTYQKTIFNECYNFSNESLSNRTIYVESEDEFSDLKNNIEKYDNVLGVFNNDYYIDGGVIAALSSGRYSL